MNGARQMSHMHKYGESKTTQIIMATPDHSHYWSGTYKIPKHLIFAALNVPELSSLCIKQLKS